MIINNKKRCLIITFLLVLSTLSGMTAKADKQPGSTHTQNLVIVKYGLNANSNAFSDNKTVNSDEKINNIPIDNNRNQLAPIAGVEYTLQKINPTRDDGDIKISDLSTYDKVHSIQTIVTGQNGIASKNLVDGFYIVTEVANPTLHLTNPTAPFLLRLPVVNEARNGYLDTVYIYPKSSIDLEQEIVVPNNTKQTVLPKTGDQSNMGIIVMGCITLLLMLSLLAKSLKGRGNK